jgi:hypothetical protein
MEKLEKLKKYYYDLCVKNRLSAIELLQKKKFKELYEDFYIYVEREPKERLLKSIYKKDIISELNKIKTLKNESEPYLRIEIDTTKLSDNGKIYFKSFIYKIKDLKFCKGESERMYKNALFYLKKQPNSSQSKAIKSILDKL